MGEIDAAGEIVTGGLIGRALEPSHGEAAGAHDGLCLNCGTALLGDYCHRCGQAGHIHRSLAAIWHDIAHGVLHLEGKIWRTLPLLAFRPGDLTRRFVAGERARFVSPMALFLFSVFLMFAVISAVGGGLHTPDPKAGAGAQAESEVSSRRAGLVVELKRIDDRIAAARAAGKDTGELRRERATVAGLLRFVEGGPTVLTEGGDDGAFGNTRTGWARLDHGIAKANANPNLLLYKLQSNAYKFSWALIPLSVPFVWAMFAWKRRYRAYDHAVFVTYSLSFMTLLIVALTLAGAAGASDGAIVAAALIVPPVHMYKQLRRAYSLRRFSAAWRTVALITFAGVVSLAFVLLLLGLGLLG